MRIITRKFELADCPAGIRRYTGQSFVTVGKEYAVYAMVSFKSVLLAQIVDDLGYPSWLPLWLFDVSDNSVPSDWVCCVSREEEMCVLGPEFIAGDRRKYRAMWNWRLSR